MTTSTYKLPDGRFIEVDSTACKGHGLIDFTLVGGKIVYAVLVTYRRPEWLNFQPENKGQN